ncbi:DNA polymerase alpha subunit B [Dictyocoela muelleri]|nr:DNA polymerase alpha subunit B [Dictyocoela muelleri]
MNFDEIILNQLKKADHKQKITIKPLKIYKKDDLFFLKKNDRLNYVLNRIDFMKQGFIDLLEINDFLSPTTQSFASFFTIGMIFSFEDRPSIDSIFLLSNFNDTAVKLNFSGLKEYSVFSGQVVAIKGKNYNGNEIFIEELFTMPIIETNDFFIANFDIKNEFVHEENKKVLELDKSMEETEDSLKKLIINKSNNGIKITTISGPLSIDDYIIFDNIQNIDSEVLILLGPFVRKEDCAKKSPLTILKELKEKIEKWIRRSMNRKAILIGSTEDFFSYGIYPQFPIPLSGNDIYCFSNPSLFYINDILFGISTEDILFELFSKELFTNPYDRINRISKNFIFQKSFLPVLPPCCTVKYTDQLNIKVVPNVFILTSKVKPFDKKIGPCLVVNLGIQRVGEDKFKHEIVVNGSNIESKRAKIV